MDIFKLSGGKAPVTGECEVAALLETEAIPEDKVLLQCMLQGAFSAANTGSGTETRTRALVSKSVWNMFLVHRGWYNEPGNKFKLQTLFPMGLVARVKEVGTSKLLRNVGKLPGGIEVTLKDLLGKYDVIVPITGITLRRGVITKMRFLGMSSTVATMPSSSTGADVFLITDVFAYSKWWTLSTTPGVGITYSEMLTSHPGLASNGRFPSAVAAKIDALRRGLVAEAGEADTLLNDLNDTMSRILDFGEVRG